MTTLNLTIPDMVCSACAETITKAVLAVDDKATVAADTTTKQVTVSTSTAPAQVTEAITAAGYTVSA